jgi:DNA-binding NtrC family response regulator
MNRDRNSVLLVEDDPWVADYIADVVTAFFGFRVLKAATAEEARKQFFENCDEIAAIISDLSLEGANGRAVVSELAGRRPEIGIIFVTGHVLHERELSKAIGRPVSLLLKPFTPLDLKTAIEARLCVDAENSIDQTVS